MALRDVISYDLGTLDAENEYTQMIFSKDFRNAIFTIIASDSANCTIKFYGSNSEDRPSLGSAASSTNIYSTTQVVALEDGEAIAGDTGVVYAGSSDGITRYEINENLNHWLGIKMTARSAGAITIKVSLSDNS